MSKQVEVWRHKIVTVTVLFCGSSTLFVNLQLKPLPHTANLFVDFCDHLFLTGKRVNTYHLTRLGVDLDKKIMLDLCTMRIKIVYACIVVFFFEKRTIV